jgi:hypothetical protein
MQLEVNYAHLHVNLVVNDFPMRAGVLNHGYIDGRAHTAEPIIMLVHIIFQHPAASAAGG